MILLEGYDTRPGYSGITTEDPAVQEEIRRWLEPFVEDNVCVQFIGGDNKARLTEGKLSYVNESSSCFQYNRDYHHCKQICVIGKEAHIIPFERNDSGKCRIAQIVCEEHLADRKTRAILKNQILFANPTVLKAWMDCLRTGRIDGFTNDQFEEAVERYALKRDYDFRLPSAA